MCAQVLALECVESTGLVFRHLAPLTCLRTLRLRGMFEFSGEGLQQLSRLRLPSLQSLVLTTCRCGWEGAGACLLYLPVLCCGACGGR